MTEEELKIKFDHIQGIFNRCINHASQVMIDNIASKSLYFDEEQADKLEQQEYVRTADELVQLYIRYSVLNDIPYFYSVSDFFWESGFYESLKLDEKRKYMSFNPLSFDYSRYEQDNTVYDEELPYFSVVVKATEPNSSPIIFLRSLMFSISVPLRLRTSRLQRYTICNISESAVKNSPSMHF